MLPYSDNGLFCEEYIMENARCCLKAVFSQTKQLFRNIRVLLIKLHLHVNTFTITPVR